MESDEATLREDTSRDARSAFCPPLGCLEAWLGQLLDVTHLSLGGDRRVVGFGGMFVPRTHPLDRDAAAKLAQDLAAANDQSQFTFPGLNLGVPMTLRMYTPPRYPGRLSCFVMECAFGRDLEGFTNPQIAGLLRSSETPQIVRRSSGPDDRRFRGADRVVARGRKVWASLGGWPWAEFRPSGTLPTGWRLDAHVIDSVHSWHAQALDAAEADLRFAAERIERARSFHLSA